MSKRPRTYLPFLILLLGLVFLWWNRWHSLSNPYFWDEMGVYGKGVQYLFANGIGVLPASLPPEISRGHPLLFSSIHALVIQVFGNKFFVSHFFALLVSSATVLSTYLLAQHSLPKVLAAAAASLLICQNIFIAQSTLVIPEMSIALISTLALWSYFKRHYLFTILVLCIGVWIKESVIIIAAFIGFIQVIELIHSGIYLKKAKQLLLFTLPLIAFIGFLLIQKVQNGWYFFPYHTEIVQESAFNGFWDKLERHYTFIFYEQGRKYWLIASLIGLFTLPFIRRGKSLLTLIGFLIVNLLVFSLAFYMDRYLLYLYPVLVILVVHGLKVLSFGRDWISLLLIAGMASLSLLELKNDTFRYDVSVSYEDVIRVHEEAVSQLCELDESSIIVGSNFPIYMSLDDFQLGYLNKACHTRIDLTPFDKEPRYLLLYQDTIQRENYTLLKSYKQGEALVNLYAKN